MADMMQLEKALRNAHSAGDTQAAQALAREITRMRGQSGQQAGSFAKEPQVVERGMLWPISKMSDNSVQFDTDSGVIGSIKRAFFLPSEVASGEVQMTDPFTGRMSDDAISRVNELAGFVTPMGVGSRIGQPSVSQMAKSLKPSMPKAKTVEEMASMPILKQINKIGRENALAQMQELGPDAMLIDILGEAGGSIGRKAANISPDAREILKSSLLGRKAGQNPRLVADIEKAAGLPAGNRLGVEGLKREAYSKVSPQINDAYEAARQVGFDLDPSQFGDILSSPSGSKAWAKSLDLVKDRAATRPMQSPIGVAPSSLPQEEAIAAARKGMSAQEKRVMNAAAPYSKAPPKPESLAEFLASRGGLQDYKGEISRGLGLKGLRVGSKKQPLISEGGSSLDYAREAAAEAGYFNHLYGNADDAVSQSTIADLLNLLDDDIRNGGAYIQGADDAYRAWQSSNEMRQEMRSVLDQISQETPGKIPDNVLAKAAQDMREYGGLASDALDNAKYIDYLEYGSAPQSVPLGKAEKVRQFSNLARLDETKRLLDDMARADFRSGNNSTGGAASDLAKVLRERMDEALQGPEYATARALRKSAYDTDAAFDLGAELARPNIPLGLPKTVSANPQATAQGYGAAMSERLLNRGSTEGALNALSTPMAGEAMQSALGPNAQMVMKALARERAFNKPVAAVTGNSTSAQQIADMLSAGGGVAGMTMAMGADATTGGGMGLLVGGLRRAGPALQRKLATRKQESLSPVIANMLVGRNIPEIPQKTIEEAVRSDTIRRLIAQSLTRGVMPLNASGE